MPAYEFMNEETEEVETHFVSFKDYDQFVEDNPHLQRVYSAPAFISQSQSSQQKAGDGWNDLMKRVKSESGEGNTIKTK